ncbi:methyltransferase [Agrobacterium rubi]|nr:methyltransferase [Agrobacterium rubi]NTF24132.1 methyltransferase [Agrobacterium rubi]
MSRNLFIKLPAKLNRGAQPTYVSLFSNAGIGCHGFHTQGFACLATAELERKRLEIQIANGICRDPAGYVCGDLTSLQTKNAVYQACTKEFGASYKGKLDVVVATPPCQGMSMVNRKKGNELNRNSLVITSIEIIKELLPKVFVIENVKLFLSSLCEGLDGQPTTIRSALWSELSGAYNISAEVINFMDYGVPSSRTRTLVVGVRRDIQDIVPQDLWPEKQDQITVRGALAGLASIENPGDRDPLDEWHSFRAYDSSMRAWIAPLREGQSAFDNIDPLARPHKVVDGSVIAHARGTRDKYRRNYWDRPAACIHTRNDCLASQSTIHPQYDRVFSVRELMRLMTIPMDFSWTGSDSLIRKVIGESVPTVIFEQIAQKLLTCVLKPKVGKENIASSREELIRILSDAATTVDERTARREAELLNSDRVENAAYYTRNDISFTVADRLPDFQGKKSIHIVEPSVGVGNFLPAIARRYAGMSKITIDCFDIDATALELAEALLKRFPLPGNVNVRFIHGDFLSYDHDRRYDLIVGNPPFGTVRDREKLNLYRQTVPKNYSNLVCFFVERALSISDNVTFILPKSIISSSEYKQLREALRDHGVRHISDLGDVGFVGVAIETVAIHTGKGATRTRIDSLVDGSTREVDQGYIFDPNFPTWLIYRDDFFDTVASSLHLGAMDAFRDRTLSKKDFTPTGRRVLKARNITPSGIVDIPGYDQWTEKTGKGGVWEFLDAKSAILVPNGTYLPRAILKPAGYLVDGSVAILTAKAGHKISPCDISFFCSEEFQKFYWIARNKGMRSLNIDKGAAFFFGLKRSKFNGVTKISVQRRVQGRGVELPGQKVA